MTKLSELREMERAASPGEWRHGIAGSENIVTYNGDDITGIARAETDDAALIVAMRNNFAALLDCVEAADSWYAFVSGTDEISGHAIIYRATRKALDALAKVLP